MQYDQRFENDSRLTIDAKMDYFPVEETSDWLETDLVNDVLLSDISTTGQRERIRFEFQADYVNTLTDNTEIEAGLKSNFDRSESQFNYSELIDGRYDDIPGFTEDFVLYENINAAYGIFSHQFDRFSFQTGLRVEQTITDSRARDLGERTEQSYFGFFPSLFLNYKINDRNVLQASYSRRLSRPWGRFTSPFTTFRDFRTLNLGGPNLEPVFTNAYEIGYIRYWESGTLSTSLYHRQSSNVIERLREVSADGLTIRNPVNLSDRSNWGLELTLNQDIGERFSVRGSLNYFLSEIQGEYEGEIIDRSSTSFFSRIRASWELTDTFRAQTTIFYRGPRESLLGDQEALYFVNLSLAKDFWDGNATLSLSGRDIFLTRERNYTIDSTDFFLREENRRLVPNIRLVFAYRFSQI